jgi:DNA-binding response OmpR family regulator
MKPTSPGIRVLLADPDPFLAAAYQEYLSEHGFAAATATSALECLEKLRGFGPDVLVLEPALAWGGGDGVLAVMNERTDVPRVPVIVLTSGRDRSAIYRMSSFRIEDYQTKPLAPAKLAAHICALLADWPPVLPAIAIEPVVGSPQQPY